MSINLASQLRPNTEKYFRYVSSSALPVLSPKNKLLSDQWFLNGAAILFCHIAEKVFNLSIAHFARISELVSANRLLAKSLWLAARQRAEGVGVVLM